MKRLIGVEALQPERLVQRPRRVGIDQDLCRVASFRPLLARRGPPQRVVLRFQFGSSHPDYTLGFGHGFQRLIGKRLGAFDPDGINTTIAMNATKLGTTTCKGWLQPSFLKRFPNTRYKCVGPVIRIEGGKMGISDHERARINERKSDELRYMTDMLRQLRDMALGRNDQLLSYLIEMAYVEAADRQRGRPDTRLVNQAEFVDRAA